MLQDLIKRYWEKGLYVTDVACSSSKTAIWSLRSPRWWDNQVTPSRKPTGGTFCDDMKCLVPRNSLNVINILI